MPLEGGLYQWAKQGFGEMAGFLIAWNLWVYAVVVVGAIIFVVPTDLGYVLGPAWAWLAASRWATLLLTGAVMAGITAVAVHGLDIGKWLHNAGSVMILMAYVILLGLPVWALMRGAIPRFEPLPWEWPKADWFSLAIFGQMTVGALSGFEYVAILAGECRSAARTIGQSVVISAPVIAVMFILGTSTVLTFIGGQPINVIGPIPQTFRAAFGTAGVAGVRRAVRNRAAAGARSGQRQPDLHRTDALANGHRLGQPGAALVHPAGPTAAYAGELHLLCGGAGDGPDSAEPAGSQGAGGLVSC